MTKCLTGFANMFVWVDLKCLRCISVAKLLIRTLITSQKLSKLCNRCNDRTFLLLYRPPNYVYFWWQKNKHERFFDNRKLHTLEW